MKKVRLGKTGEEVSKLGFGVSGPHGSQLVGRNESVSLIRKAIKAGYTVFDTAPPYGDGEAESRLGLALKNQDADALFIMTKAGVLSAGMGRKRRDFTPDAIELSLQDSLRRFALGHADALFLHGPAPHELTDALMQRLDLLRSVGAFRFLGICGRGEELDAGIDSGVFDLMMAPCPPNADETQLHRFERANKAGMGTIAIEVMRGLKRSGLPKTGGDVWYAARQLRSVLSPDRTSAAVDAEAALRTALARADVDVVMTTTTRADNLAANAALAGT
ncbi:aldo/keto reductase [Hyphobacterium sp. SN044]|uniref:aldo/keto reductase n=1 Tax=Hyphobacterium sp. SN044 TaxID=2912575 RepID=UPI001F3F30E5|nr:aldo/keto reductase [Hyphobacterium sp. SN044]